MCLGGGRWNKDFYLHHTVQTDFRDCRLPGSLFLRGKGSSPENHDPPPSGDEVKNVWNCIFTLQDCVFQSLIAEILVPFFFSWKLKKLSRYFYKSCCFGCVLRIRFLQFWTVSYFKTMSSDVIFIVKILFFML